jgi:hypothetical protein
VALDFQGGFRSSPLLENDTGHGEKPEPNFGMRFLAALVCGVLCAVVRPAPDGACAKGDRMCEDTYRTLVSDTATARATTVPVAPLPRFSRSAGAMELIQDGESTQAKALVLDILQTDPGNLRAHRILANVLESEGDASKARPHSR